MKKAIFILAAVIVAAASCKKETNIINAPQSIPFDVQASSWSTFDDSITWLTNLPAGEITSSVINSGAVAVYWVYNDNNVGTVNEQIPYYYYDQEVLFTATIYIGTVQVGIESTNGDKLNNPGTYEFRVVIQDGSGKKAAEVPANWHQVKTTVKLGSQAPTGNVVAKRTM